MAGRLELSVRNSTAVVANIYAADRMIKHELADAVKDTAEYVRAQTYRMAAVDTSFMRDHIRIFTTPKSLVYEVGWDVLDFVGEGKAFYPFFVEFGTRNMAAQPALIPAGQMGKAYLRRRTARAIVTAVARTAALRRLF